MTRAALQKFYESVAWRRMAKVAKRRDGFLCVRCRQEGFTVAADVVHHLKPITAGGEKLSLDNTVSLCRIHHESAHGRGPSTEQREWGKYMAESRLTI